MKISDYNLYGFDFLRSPLKTYITLKTTPFTIDMFEVVGGTEDDKKAVQLTLASAPVLYRGQPKFWIPKSAFKKFESLDQVLELKDWFIKSMDAQAKINLNISF
jgi:hypothetical protein